MKDKIENSNNTCSGWNQVTASDYGKNTFNPIRTILETMKIKPNPEKKMISLSIGDPTIFKNLQAPDVALKAVKDSLDSGEYNGYAPSSGYQQSRQAIADHIGEGWNNITADDVIICSGCSCALDMCIGVIANPGENILVPRPGFPLYKTLAHGFGIETKEYDLLPEKGWQVDLAHLESLIEPGKTKAILVNNPSNPCGSVFDRDHLLDIIAIAEKHFIPIIADEIYEHFVFAGAKKDYIPIASLTRTVPVLSCGGLTKRWLVPGWRLGWITVHDRNEVFKRGGVRSGLNSLSQRIIGANTLVQGAVPAILRRTPKNFYKDTLEVIEENAKLAYKKLSAVPGLNPVMPDGAMYMMVGMDPRAFSGFESDLQIVEGMVREQSVFPLPGMCFNIKNFFRIVLTVPKNNMVEACDRIAEFCAQHYTTPTNKHLRMVTETSEYASDMTVSSSSSSSVNSVVNSSDEEEETTCQKPSYPTKITQLTTATNKLKV